MISSKIKEDMLPPRFSDVDYQKISKQIRKTIATAFIARKGLYIFGSAGTGKTYIAYGIWQRCREKNILCRFYKETDLLDMIRDSYDSRYKDDILEDIKSFNGVLVIDDIGVSKPSGWVAETYYKIIDRFYEDKKIIVFTSNKSLGELAHDVNDRIPSRIAEMCEIIKLNGSDRRL